MLLPAGIMFFNVFTLVCVLAPNRIGLATVEPCKAVLKYGSSGGPSCCSLQAGRLHSRSPDEGSRANFLVPGQHQSGGIGMVVGDDASLIACHPIGSWQY